MHEDPRDIAFHLWLKHCGVARPERGQVIRREWHQLRLCRDHLYGERLRPCGLSGIGVVPAPRQQHRSAQENRNRISFQHDESLSYATQSPPHGTTLAALDVSKIESIIFISAQRLG